MKREILLFFIFTSLLLSKVYSQAPQASFDIPLQACKGEQVDIVNSSLDAEYYKWSFCNSDLSSDVINSLSNKLNSAKFTLGAKVIFDGANWYGFVTSRSTNTLHRLDFGADVASNPTPSQSIVNTGDFLSSPDKIVFYKENGIWYALITNDGSPYNLIKLTFKNGLSETPEVENLGNFEGMFARPRGLDIVLMQNQVVAVISNVNTNKLTLINFGTSIDNPVTIDDVTESGVINGANQLMGLGVVEKDGKWFVFVLSANTGKLHRLDFDNNLLGPYSEHVYNEVTFSSPYDIKVRNDGNNFFGFVSQVGGQVERLILGNDFAATSLSELPIVSADPMANMEAIDVFNTSGQWVLFGLNYQSANSYRYNFEWECNANIETSTEESPSNIYFSKAGEQQITLTVYGTNGKSKDVLKKTIEIIDNQSPDVSFNFGEARCVNTTNNFDGSTASEITTWSWSFGDGTTATGQNVTHQYAAAGTYTVRLSVESADGCNNFTEQEITIYEEPVADYTVPIDVCSNSPAIFENTSTAVDGVTVYTWDFGDGNTLETTSKDPVEHIYEAGGDYTVTLTAAIPGCESVIQQLVTIQSGPSPEFSFAKVCFDEVLTITDQSTGNGITSHEWVLMNETQTDTLLTSTVQNPEFHTGQLAPDTKYWIGLRVDNDKGCSSTLLKETTVYALPEADFEHFLACENIPTTFRDLSAVAGANITDWEWNFGDGNTINGIKEPEHTFQASGVYNVQLTVTSNFGCQSTVSREVTVHPEVDVDFDFVPGCEGEPAQFIDRSSVTGSAIESWYWEIDGSVYETANPQHLFAGPGTYTVSLTVTPETRCDVTLSRTVEVFAPAEPAFSVSNVCSNAVIYFTDESVLNGNSLLERRWIFDNTDTLKINDPAYVFESAGSHSVKLQLVLSNGCIVESFQAIEVAEPPKANIAVEYTSGAYPFEVQFENRSADAESYQWDFGTGDTSTEAEPVYTFTEPGVYTVQLEARNSLACTDVTTLEITVLEPVLEVKLEEVTIFSSNDEIKLKLTIRNEGSVLIDNTMDILVDFGDKVKLKEPFRGRLGAGQEVQYSLDLSLLQNSNQPADYICVTLLPSLGAEEADTDNNQACVNLAEGMRLVSPYPNPTQDELTVPLIVPAADVVRVCLFDTMGAEKFDMEVAAEKGLNEIQLTTKDLRAGIYILRLNYKGKEEVRMIQVVR